MERPKKRKYRFTSKSPRNKQLNVRFTDSEFLAIKTKADLYCNGCMSEWVRYAASTLMPRKRDLIDETDTLKG